MAQNRGIRSSFAPARAPGDESRPFETHKRRPLLPRPLTSIAIRASCCNLSPRDTALSRLPQSSALCLIRAPVPAQRERVVLYRRSSVERRDGLTEAIQSSATLLTSVLLCSLWSVRARHMPGNCDAPAASAAYDVAENAFMHHSTNPSPPYNDQGGHACLLACKLNSECLRICMHACSDARLPEGQPPANPPPAERKRPQEVSRRDRKWRSLTDPLYCTDEYSGTTRYFLVYAQHRTIRTRTPIC